ncbi:MAG: iron-sulfur cluster-binding protein [Firmicutes bacterium]|nr:iron-sulfur cluster-binding protein [Bacillota bacterium]
MTASAGSMYERAAAAVRDSRLGEAVRRTTDSLRTGRRRAVRNMDDFEALREHARRIRAHTVDHLDYYLAQLAGRVREAGGHVFFARTARDAIDYVLEVAQRHRVRTVVKSKSMISEELELNAYLAKRGIRAVETDLGEYIVQLGGDRPAHLITPALHKSRAEIVRLFEQEAGHPLSPDTQSLTAFARARLRQEFLRADMGITGCNFAVAETGSICLVTNEGNGRMVTSLPRVQVTLMGMERIVPTLDDLDVMLELLARSATGQKLTVYTNLITGPRRPGETDGPEELHLVIVDNGRSHLLGSEFQEALHCIRCGACQNVCPVYRHIGGHAYGWVYGGPIGAVITPLLRGVPEWGQLAEASSLCAACTEVCPVKIPLHDMLIGLRHRVREQGRAPLLYRALFRLWANAVADSRRFGLALRLWRILQRPFVRDNYWRWAPPPLSRWLAERDLPAVAPRSFREWWQTREAGSPDSPSSNRPVRSSHATGTQHPGAGCKSPHGGEMHE